MLCPWLKNQLRNWVLSRDNTTCRSEYIHETLQNRYENNELRRSLKSKRAAGDQMEAAGTTSTGYYGKIK